MKINVLMSLFALAAFPALASAQERRSLWSEPTLTQEVGPERPGPRGGGGGGGRVREEWDNAEMRAAVSIFGRASFPGDTDVTIDHVTYADLFDAGLGIGVELDFLSYIAPHWAVGGYLSVGWDSYNGQRHTDDFGDSVTPDDMSLTTVIGGVKVYQRFGPFVSWEGRMGLGMVHYSAVNSTFDVGGVTTTDVRFFRPINRGVFEIGGRIGFGNRHIEGDFGFGLRYMGAAARGDDVTNSIDPDLFFTFMLELGLSIRF